MAVASLFEDLLDQYKIEQHIAEKHYTDLFQAYDVDIDRQVRLDILRPEYAEDSSFSGRFVNRARAIAQVRHSNIAPVLHIGKVADGAPYVAQAAINGYPLSHRLEQLAQRNSPAHPIYALKLIRQLTDALLLAERLELYHYDLQPDNVLLKSVTSPSDDSVVLIDLFIPSERANRGRSIQANGSGSAFLSPEQRGGRDVTAAGHVYSLGAMLYHLLAGHAPSRPNTLHDTVLTRLFGRPTPLERERGDLSQATYDLVNRSLRKDPRGRYQTIEAFTAALDGALAAEEARLGTANGKALGAGAGRRSLAWLLPAVLVILLLGAVGLVAQNIFSGSNGATGETQAAITAPSTEMAGVVTSPTDPPPQSTPSPEPTAAAGGSGGEDVGSQPTDTRTGVIIAPGQTRTATAEATNTSTPSTTPTQPPASTLTSPPPELPSVHVLFNLVNMRRGPGVNYPLAGTVAGGDLLELLAWNNDEENPWFLVMTADQRIGWIAAAVVELFTPEELAAIPVAATVPATPLPTSTPTRTPTVAVIITPIVTLTPANPGLELPTAPPPPTSPPAPTAEPTDPPIIEPTRTPPPLPTTSP